MRNYWLRMELMCSLVHTLALSIDVEQRGLAHLIVKEAYALGAHEVIVQWTDDVINREIPPRADGASGQCARNTRLLR